MALDRMRAIFLCLCAQGALASFPCGGEDTTALPAKTVISEEDAEALKCCTKLPCKYKKGCWGDQMPPLYSATRVLAVTRDEANRMEKELLWPAVESGIQKTFVGSMPDHGWYRVPVPHDKYPYFYDGIKRGFKQKFNASLVTPIMLDIFFVTDFDDKWADDSTYTSDFPDAAYWIHNDCSNFRICYEESGYISEQFTGNGVAFVLPVALPSEVDFRDGHDHMPAALELYNISHGHRDEMGELVKPWNRQWMSAHRYNLGEIIFFNAFRWHSGFVPRKSEFVNADNPHRKRAETVGFAAELKTGDWVLFRMCKGSTDDSVRKKILTTDINPTSCGESKGDYLTSAEEAKIHNPLGALRAEL